MCGEERAAADLLGQLLHYGAGDGCAIVCGSAPPCKPKALLKLLPGETVEAFQGKKVT